MPMRAEHSQRSLSPFISSFISVPAFSSDGDHSMGRTSIPSSATTFSGSGGSRSGSSSRYANNTRHLPSSFAYNGRLAIALAPCAAFLLDIGGTPVVATLTVGLLISYVFDSLNFKSGAFIGVWMSLILAQIAFFFNSSFAVSFGSLFLALIAALLCAETSFLIGVWASLQFKWLQLENPSIVLALERLLFACIPFVASSLFTWATISAVGMANAAYYLMAFNCAFYWLFSLPHISSFKLKQEIGYHGGEVPLDLLILSSMENCLHTLHLLFSPLLFHGASHRSLVFSSASTISDAFLLFFIPFLFQLYASTRDALWWVSTSDYQLHRIRVVNGAFALIIVVICLEVRVVFHSFDRFIQVQPPFSYVLVTATMLGGAAAAGAYALGLVMDAFSSLAFTILTVTVSISGALVVGFPILLLPAPALSGFYLARFLMKKSLPSYFTFVLLGSLVVIWFVLHNFWDLNIWLAGMPLKSFCKFIVANVIITMSIPGFALLPAKLDIITDVALICHALLLCYVENRLFSYSNMYHYGAEEEVMYPSYMVLFTSIIGIVLVRKLSSGHLIRLKTIWILTCLYLSKLFMLLISSKTAVWSSAVLMLAVSPPLLLYREKSKGYSKMKAWQGYMHACMVVLSVWFCRDTIFEALQWWLGMPPSDSLLVGFCIVFAGVACIPLVAIHFSNTVSARRWLVLVVAMGFLFIMMQPPIPSAWAYESGLMKAARHSADDISIYGLMASKPTWTSWLLISAILLLLAAATSAVPVGYTADARMRMIYSIILGIALGVYICTEYFHPLALLRAFVVGTMVCTSVFASFVYFPSASSTVLLPWVFALLVALFPVEYLLEGQLRIKSIGQDGTNEAERIAILEGTRTSLLALHASIFMLIALVIKSKLTVLTRENRTSSHPKGRFVQHRRSASVPMFTTKRIAGEGAWLPAVGNIATLMCFCLCLILNFKLTGGSNRAIFFLSPVLLLLNQDADFITGFGDKQRYFPIILAISVYLTLTAMYNIWEDVWNSRGGWFVEIGGADWRFAVKNCALLIFTFPSHILFNRYVWNQAKRNDPTPILVLPLNLLPIIVTDEIKVKILGLLGIIYSLTQYLISRQDHITGLKYI